MWWEGYRVSGGRRARERERERVGRQCGWVFGHPFVLTQSQLNRWVPPEGSGTEGERGSVSGLKGHMTQGRTTQLTGVNPQSNIHYKLGYPPICSPTPKYTITLKMPYQHSPPQPPPRLSYSKENFTQKSWPSCSWVMWVAASKLVPL